MKSTVTLVIFFLIFLSSCANQTTLENDSISVFGFDHSRTGTYKSSFNLEDFKNLSLIKPEWGADASGHMPLSISYKIDQLEKKVLVFGTNKNSIRAYDYHNNVIDWDLDLPGELTATPVYHHKSNLIYASTNDFNKPAFARTTLWVIDLNGKVQSQKNINLKDIFLSHGVTLTEEDFDILYTRTALSLNDINEDPYIFLGFSTGYNPYIKNPKFRRPYGKTRGLTGLLAGYYIDKKTGLFTDRAPLSFVPSIITKNKLTGYNTGIYLSGGNPSLLQNNIIILPTGNGPSFGEEENYGCSIVSIDGKNFRPIKGSKGYSYLSRDPKGHHECFESNIDLASSAATVFDGKKKSTGFIQDKYGSLFIFDPNALTGNSPHRKELNSVLDFPGVHGLVYNKGSVFKNDSYLNYIFSLNSNRSSSYPKAILPSNELIENYYKSKNYEKLSCLGLIAKQGSKENKLSYYYSGTVKNRSLISLSDHYRLIEDQTIYELQKTKKNIKPFITFDRVIPLIQIGEYGYALTPEDKTPPGYKRMNITLGSSITSQYSYFTRFYSIFNETKDYDSKAPIYNNLNKNLDFLENRTFDIYSVESSKNSLQCPDFDHDRYIPLYLYGIREDFEFKKGFKLYSMELNTSEEASIKWSFQGEENEIIEKNAIVTIVNNYKRVTLFNAINENSLKSFVYIIDANTGVKIAKYEIGGKLYFSSLIYTPLGIIAPTVNNGLNILKRNH